MNKLTSRGALAAALVLTLALAACGGHPSDAGSTVSGQSVQGVSTPSSVSVVTAKNAN